MLVTQHITFATAQGDLMVSLFYKKTRYITYRDPSALNDTDFGSPCMAAYGGPVDPNVALGDFGKCDKWCLL